MKNFAIYACFSRSFDHFHINKNKIHLISSTMGCYQDFSIVTKYLDRIEESFGIGGSDSINYIFMVVDKPGLTKLVKNIDIDAIDKEKTIFEICRGNVTVIVLTIDQLIGHLSFTKKDNELFENIFGTKNLKQKDFDLIYQNSLFIFYNMFWSNIIMKFKLCDVHISGGCASRRHVLSSVELQLSYFLNELYNYNLPLKEFYNVSKSIILSKTIPFDVSKNITSQKDDITKLSLKTFNENMGNITINNELTNFSNISIELEKFINENLLLSFDILQNAIVTDYESKILKFKDLISSLNKDCSSLTFQIEGTDNLINNIRPSGLSSKQKKKFKEERNLILKDLKSNSITHKLNLQLQNNLSQIEDLKNKVIRTELELEKFKINFGNMSIKELNVLYEKISKDEIRVYKYSKFKK